MIRSICGEVFGEDLQLLTAVGNGFPEPLQQRTGNLGMAGDDVC